MTIDTKLQEANGRPSGFDYLRLILSILVLSVHCFAHTMSTVQEAQVVWNPFPINAIVKSILPMFFALSGFLVAGSLFRCATLMKFISLRFIRIYPALFVEVVITALLLGPFVVQMPVWEYYTSDGFFRYLVNVTGHTTVFLPGAFEGNVRENIANLQLWTVPYELFCYIALSLLLLVGGRRDRRILLTGTILAFIGYLVRDLIGYSNGELYVIQSAIVPTEGPATGKALIVAFLCGVSVYAYRDILSASGRVMIGLSAVTLLLFNLDMFGDQVAYIGQQLALVSTAYLTCVLGVTNFPRLKLLRHADLSYGIFLYHGIIQQTILYFWPWQMGPLGCFVTSLPVSITVAWLSWTYIEKPALNLRKLIDKAEERFFTGARMRASVQKTDAG